MRKGWVYALSKRSWKRIVPEHVEEIEEVLVAGFFDDLSSQLYNGTAHWGVCNLADYPQIL
jgi:hypothetical protein